MTFSLTKSGPLALSCMIAKDLINIPYFIVKSLPGPLMPALLPLVQLHPRGIYNTGGCN